MKIIAISHEDFVVIRHNARLAAIGGMSYIYAPAERQKKLIDDQVTGQLGEAAFCICKTGSIAAYRKHRAYRNSDPYAGDGGIDFIFDGQVYDVKTSRMRAANGHHYHLWVRPAEYHPDVFYVLALVPEGRNDTVHIMGYARGEELEFDKNNKRFTLNETQLTEIW